MAFAPDNMAAMDEIDRLTAAANTQQIYTYESDFQNNAIAFRNRRDNQFQFAVGSFETDSMDNKVEIVDLSLAHPNDGFRKVDEFTHQFPPTKIQWVPSTDENEPIT